MANIHPITYEEGRANTIDTSTYSDKTLKEDEDQGEMDTVFFILLITYTIALFSMEFWYPDEKDYLAVGHFHLVMSNLWAFFPIMQAQGLWLKILLICTCYYSILWHWTETGAYLPGDRRVFGRWDAIFSTCVIVAYCLSWLPKFKTKIPTADEERKYCWYHNCRGRPKETSEWRCRWTPNLILSIVICFLCGLAMFYGWSNFKFDFTIVVCWFFITVAFVTAIYQLVRGKMRIGEKNRKKFAFWAFLGMVFGPIAFVYKQKSNFDGPVTFYQHSIWHVYVHSCAYSFSRASEYLEIY